MNSLNIITERLIIRNLKSSDVNQFHSYRSNPDVTKYQSFDVMSLDSVNDFIKCQKDKSFGKAGEWVQYGIEEKKSSELIGDCAIKLDEYDVRIAEIGITLSPIYQKKGFASETMIGIINFLFSINDFHRIVEIVDAENSASINLLEKVGFKREGHFIENIFFKGKWGSEYQYAMLKSDWETLKQRL